MNKQEWIASLEKDIAWLEEQLAIKPLTEEEEKALKELCGELDFMKR